MNLPMVFSLLTRVALCLAVLATAHAVDTEFPSFEKARRVRGELVSADFIHRAGQFRTEKGELTDFTMPPYGIMKFHGCEADMRDVPLGTNLEFVLLPDAQGKFTRLATTESFGEADASQRKKFEEFTKARGVAGWIEKTEGRNVTVTFFSGDPAAFKINYADLLTKGKEARVCVANDELRTWNPGVDGERGSITEVTQVPTDRLGCSGYRVVVSVPNMLEGFRRGRVVRVFLAGWKAQDQPYGESLMGYGYGRMLDQELVENVAKEYPGQFPFRTDYGNEKLPWYRLKPGQEPPPFSEHVFHGALVKPGQFLTEGTGEAVDFTLIEKAKVRYRHADAALEDIPPGTRCRFHLYQDGKGAFTKANLVSDDCSHRAGNFVVLRIDALHLERNRVDVSWLLPEVKDYNGDMKRPDPIGHGILRVTKDARLWKQEQRIERASLAVGDVLLVNTTAEIPGSPAQCSDAWIGDDVLKQLTEASVKRRPAKK